MTEMTSFVVGGVALTPTPDKSALLACLSGVPATASASPANASGSASSRASWAQWRRQHWRGVVDIYSRETLSWSFRQPVNDRMTHFVVDAPFALKYNRATLRVPAVSDCVLISLNTTMVDLTERAPRVAFKRQLLALCVAIRGQALVPHVPLALCVSGFDDAQFERGSNEVVAAEIVESAAVRARLDELGQLFRSAVRRAFGDAQAAAAAVIPVSAHTGENVRERRGFQDSQVLSRAYSGPTLLEFVAACKPIDFARVLGVIGAESGAADNDNNADVADQADKAKSDLDRDAAAFSTRLIAVRTIEMGNSYIAIGRVLSGTLQTRQKFYLVPNCTAATVQSIEINKERVESAGPGAFVGVRFDRFMDRMGQIASVNVQKSIRIPPVREFWAHVMITDGLISAGFNVQVQSGTVEARCYVSSVVSVSTDSKDHKSRTRIAKVSDSLRQQISDSTSVSLTRGETGIVCFVPLQPFAVEAANLDSARTTSRIVVKSDDFTVACTNARGFVISTAPWPFHNGEQLDLFSFIRHARENRIFGVYSKNTVYSNSTSDYLEWHESLKKKSKETNVREELLTPLETKARFIGNGKQKLPDVFEDEENRNNPGTMQILLRLHKLATEYQFVGLWSDDEENVYCLVSRVELGGLPPLDLSKKGKLIAPKKAASQGFCYFNVADIPQARDIYSMTLTSLAVMTAPDLLPKLRALGTEARDDRCVHTVVDELLRQRNYDKILPLLRVMEEYNITVRSLHPAKSTTVLHNILRSATQFKAVYNKNHFVADRSLRQTLYKITEYLLHAGVSAQHGDRMLGNPLVFAAYGQLFDCADLLIQHGARVTSPEVLRYVAQAESSALWLLFFVRGASPNDAKLTSYSYYQRRDMQNFLNGLTKQISQVSGADGDREILDHKIAASRVVSLSQAIADACNNKAFHDHTIVAPHENNAAVSMSVRLLQLVWPTFRVHWKHAVPPAAEDNDSSSAQVAAPALDPNAPNKLPARYSMAEFNLLLEVLMYGEMVSFMEVVRQRCDMSILSQAMQAASLVRHSVLELAAIYLAGYPVPAPDAPAIDLSLSASTYITNPDTPPEQQTLMRDEWFRASCIINTARFVAGDYLKQPFSGKVHQGMLATQQKRLYELIVDVNSGTRALTADKSTSMVGDDESRGKNKHLPQALRRSSRLADSIAADSAFSSDDDDDDGNEGSKSMHRNKRSLDIGNLPADVTICAGGRRIRAHRLILSLRVPYFASLFGSKFKEADSEDVTLSDVSSEALRVLILFVYSDRVRISADHVLEVLECANRLNFRALQIYCERILSENLDVDNCVDLLPFAELYNAKLLKWCAMTYVAIQIKHSDIPGRADKLLAALVALNDAKLHDTVLEIMAKTPKLIA